MYGPEPGLEQNLNHFSFSGVICALLSLQLTTWSWLIRRFVCWIHILDRQAEWVSEKDSTSSEMLQFSFFFLANHFMVLMHCACRSARKSEQKMSSLSLKLSNLQDQENINLSIVIPYILGLGLNASSCNLMYQVKVTWTWKPKIFQGVKMSHFEELFYLKLIWSY